MEKRGQVTIFVIIAVVIVAIILVAYFYPQIKAQIGRETDPARYLRDCITPEIRKDVSILGNQGSYENNTDGIVQYKGMNVRYLCYNSEYYKKCYVQQPKIREHFENSLNDMIGAKARSCVDELKDYYKSRGYDVSGSGVQTSVSIVPNKVNINFKAPMTITKESTQTFEEFDANVDSSIYDLITISTSIIDFEASYGDSETLLYLKYYPNLKIQKDILDDGTTIYNVSSTITNENFMFASRSIAWPAGYGLENSGGTA